MELIVTDDGSKTYYRKDIDESYHSTSGALMESFYKFAIPSLEKKLKKDEIIILDVCFGLGYNTVCALHYLLQNNPTVRIKIIALELNEDVLLKIKKMEVPALIKKECEMIRDIYEKKIIHTDKIAIKLIKGDALSEIKKIEEKFDAIFLDPFSPKKAPELWSVEFMKDLFSHTKEGGILTTYSCARIVRDNLRNAGFEVLDGPSIGRKAPSTIAKKKN